MSAHAAKPAENDCRVLEVIFGPTMSFVPIDAENIRVNISAVYVTAVHKDGTREPMILLGRFNKIIKATNAQNAEIEVKKQAIKQGTQILKMQKCPQHGCNK